MTDTTNLRKWIQELRTTDRPQGTDYLARKNEAGEMEYCCLGIGCEVAGIKSRMKASRPSVRLFSDVDTLAPRGFIHWLGFDTEAIPAVEIEVDLFLAVDWSRLPLSVSDRLGGVDRTEHAGPSLAQLNDHGFTFSEIADLIERYGLRENYTGQTISL